MEAKHWHCPMFILLSGVLYIILHSRPLPKNHDLSDLTSADKEYRNAISLISTLKAFILYACFQASAVK
jgi:hypothetical protein